jgi:hypothetical protein
MAKEKEITDVESTTTPAHWQWIKGDDSGNVVTFKEEGSQWITFNEGGRIATGLRDEFLQPLDADVAGEFIKTPTSHDPLNVGGSQASGIPVNIKPIEDKKPSPIRTLFNKQKRNTKVKLLLDFPVNIPPKGIYELISTSFDKDEVDEHLFSFILDQLSQEEITNCLLDSIKSLIESKYKSE